MVYVLSFDITFSDCVLASDSHMPGGDVKQKQKKKETKYNIRISKTTFLSMYVRERLYSIKGF